MHVGSAHAAGEAIIAAAVRRWWRAWETKDSDTLGEMALETYVEFTGHSESHRVGRGTLLAVAARAFGRFTIRSWSVDDIIVRRAGDAAVAAYRWRSEVEEEGRVAIRQGVATDVLVHHDGAWSYVAHHSTGLADTAGA